MDSGIGLGSSFTTDAMTLVPVYFFQANRYTKATEINTNSDEKAIEDYAILTMKDAMEQIQRLHGSVFQGNESNTLDTVVSFSNGDTTINTNNANLFVDDQDIDVVCLIRHFQRNVHRSLYRRPNESRSTSVQRPR